MDGAFGHRYYQNLYAANLKSIIGNCQAKNFDALNGNGCEYNLNEVYAYLEAYHWFYKRAFSTSETRIYNLHCLFEQAVRDLNDVYKEQTGFELANIKNYKSLINTWDKAKFYYRKEETEHGNEQG